MTWNGEFLGMDLLRDGKIEMTPLAIAALFVRRNGIMNLGFYSIVQEVLLQSVTLRAENGKDVIDGVARSETRTRILLALSEP